MIAIVLLLTACKPTVENLEQVETFLFNGSTYEYSDTTSSGYDLFNGNGQLFEIKCDDECTMSFELDEDIYIIIGTSESYEISKNGTIILIDGTNQTPTGTEIPEWNEDLPSIFTAYKK